MENSGLFYNPGNEISIANKISSEMSKLIFNQEYRRAITSPNGTEKALLEESFVPDIVRLKEDLDILIEDASKEVSKSGFLQKAIISY